MSELKKLAQAVQENPDAIWQWCSLCERASRSHIAYNCGYEGCDAGIESIFTWSYIRTDNPDMPEEPEIGVVYRITGKK